MTPPVHYQSVRSGVLGHLFDLSPKIHAPSLNRPGIFGNTSCTFTSSMIIVTHPPKSTKYNQGEGLLGHTTKGRGKRNKKERVYDREGREMEESYRSWRKGAGWLREEREVGHS